MPTSTPIGTILDRVAILRDDDANPELASGDILFVVPAEHARLVSRKYLPADVLVEAEIEPRRDGFWRVFWAPVGADVHDEASRTKVQRWGYPETFPAVEP